MGAKQQSTKQKSPRAEAERNRQGFPTFVATNNGIAFYQGLAPITGDALYKGSNREGNEHHAVVCNPDAHEHQQSYFVAHERG